MAFCQYCGTNLEEGAVCNCEGAVQARTASAPAPAPNVSAPTPAPAPAYAPAPPAAPNQAAETAKATMNEVSGTLKAFVKDPMAVTSSEKDMGLFAALTLLAVQALLFTILVWVFTADMRESITDAIKSIKDSGMKPSEITAYLKDMGMNYSSGGFIFNLIVTSLLNSGIIFGALFICAKIFKSNDDYKKILSTVSLASIPWSILFVLFTLVRFVVESPSKGLANILVAVTIFIFVSSICLLFSGLTKSIQNGYKRMLSVSLAYGVGVPVYFFLLGKLLEKAPVIGQFIGSATNIFK